MPPNRLPRTLVKSLVTLALPGMYLVYKYNQFKRNHQENSKKKVTEKELLSLNHKIDKLLAKLDEHDAEGKFTDDDECVVCLSAKATMQTFPCGHKVVCRKCFVKTIQMAVEQRCLPLKCVVCRTRVLKLKQSGEDGFTPPSSRRATDSPRTSSGSRLFAKLFSSKSSHSSSTSAQQQQHGAILGGGGAVAMAPHETSSASPSPHVHRRRSAVEKSHHYGVGQRHGQQPVVSTKRMQPWLIYPSVNDPKQQRAFLPDAHGDDVRSLPRQRSSSNERFVGVASKRHVMTSHTEGPFSPAQTRPKHHCSPLTSSRIAELKHAHMLSPRIPRCSQCIEQQRRITTVGRTGSAS